MKFNFIAPIELKVYGEIEANSLDEAKEKIVERLRICPTITFDDGETVDCDSEWDIHYPCHGNVCNFYGGGINLQEAGEESK